MRSLLVLPLLAACTGNDDVSGPFSGTVERYAIDRYELPTTSDQATHFGDDLNGDGKVDNALGAMFASLSADDNLNLYASSIAAAGLLPSTIEIQAESFQDGVAGVSYIGKPGDTAVPAGGYFDAGNFRSNRTATTQHPGEGSLV